MSAAASSSLPAAGSPADAAPASPIVDLPVIDVTAEAFAPFGTVMPPAEDGVPFGPHEAQLDLSRGTPRFYVMRLHRRPLEFDRITRHLAVTQCLAAVGGRPWLLAVAPPAAPDDPSAVPDPATIRAFRIPGDVAIALHRSTWHAGPFFEDAVQDFFNLELADTNQVDHHTCRLAERFGSAFRFAVPDAR